MKKNIVSISRNLFLTIVALVTMSSFFVMPKNALADWNPSYIIQDDRFAAISMNQQQVQAFLSSKGGYLANYRETRNSYVGPNNNRPAINKLASQIIYEAAADYGLNPQVILATLQKEQSLVTNPSPAGWNIDWAMGYGCPDGGSCSSYPGFSMQVDWGSWQLRWNMDRANDPATRYKVAPYYTGNTINIDGFSTYLGTGATASLYRYTPHFHGNQNFRLIFTQWFGDIDYTGGITSVYRFWNINGTHFYTASATERDNVGRRWGNIYRYEGVAYNITNNGANNIQLYRFYNMRNGTHFYTISPAERDNVVRRWGNIYRYEGVAYYVSSSGTPVYRFYNISNGTHFYTASAAERDNVGRRWGNIYRYEGEAFYVQ